MTNTPAVSVVMPIYNASDFLKESLGGILQQTLKNIEIICVNDGSKDDSLEIMQRYAYNDKRIKIIDKPNGGYGHSMNAGIKIATGEYIAILEPDDFVDNNMLEVLYGVAKKNDADVVKSNYYEYSTKQNSNTFQEVLFEQEYDKVTCAKENERIVYMRPCIWTAIYRREFLKENGIVFNETPGASYQDTAFAFKVWVSAERVYFIKDAFHHYRIDNDNSSVKSTGKIFSICDEFQSMQSFLNKDKNKKDRYSKILQVLKLDSYMWNLDRIAPEFKQVFKDQMALDYLKAEYENCLDKAYFDEYRWNQLQTILNEYKNREQYINDLNREIYEIQNSNSFKFGHAVMKFPSAIKHLFKK